MIHADARTPDQFYDERYDSYICFLMRGSRRSKTTQSAVFQPRCGGEAALIGEEGRSNNHHGDEAAPLWPSSVKEYCSFLCTGGGAVMLFVQLHLVHTSNNFVFEHGLGVAKAIAMYEPRKGILFTCRLPWQQQLLSSPEVLHDHTRSYLCFRIETCFG